MNKKAMALETIAYLIIGIVSVTLLLMLFSGSMTKVSKNVYCEIYDVLLLKLPFSEVTPPTYCRKNNDEIKTEEIYNTNDFTSTLVGKIVKCYLNSRKAPIANINVCEELVLKRGLSESIDERDITEYLINNDLCNIIQNSDVVVNGVTCGGRNGLIFNVEGGRIDSNTGSVFIIYNYTSDSVIIKG